MVPATKSSATGRPRLCELKRNQELDSDREEVDIERFWRQRPDWMAINHKECIIYIIEFKRTMDLQPSFKANAETRTTRQHEWLAQTLTKVGARSGWKVQVIIFTGGTMGSVEVEGVENNLKTLDVKKKAWGLIRKQHARALLEAHDEVLRGKCRCCAHTRATAQCRFSPAGR